MFSYEPLKEVLPLQPLHQWERPKCYECYHAITKSDQCLGKFMGIDEVSSAPNLLDQIGLLCFLWIFCSNTETEMLSF